MGEPLNRLGFVRTCPASKPRRATNSMLCSCSRVGMTVFRLCRGTGEFVGAGENMQRERWKIVDRLLEQVEGTTGRLVMAVAADPLDVVLYETPVLGRSQSPQNPLRGFVQEAVLLLEQPTASEL